MGYMRLVVILGCFLISNLLSQANEIALDQLEFRRQAVHRTVFDRSQDIPLSSLKPAKIVDIDVMHPEIGEQAGNAELSLDNGNLRISSQNQATVTRWVGSFNPFATYSVFVENFSGNGEVALIFEDLKERANIKTALIAKDGAYRSVSSTIIKNGENVAYEEFTIAKPIRCDEQICFRTQMVAVGLNLFIEQEGQSVFIGRLDFVRHFDLRQKKLMRHFDFCLQASLDAGSVIIIKEATSAITPGFGQADLRAITYEDGTPYWENDRLWITMTLRGGGLPHPMQGVFSLNPSVFDVKFEGIILFDRGDGLLRNELASNIFYDSNAKQWRGFTTGFSAYGDPEKKEEKQIWAVQSTKAPLKGISIMKSESVGLVGMYEDPQCIYDAKAGKWRMLLCDNDGEGFRAAIRESKKWKGPYERIAGPVAVDSTGTQIQTIGGKRYALFGSADRKVYIYTYPDLKPAGELKMYLPPWNEKTGGRIWPNVIPLPDGYPADYMALMMDRVNYPGIKGPNWTYGALYLYYASYDSEPE